MSRLLENPGEAKVDTKAKYLGLAEGQELVESIIALLEWMRRWSSKTKKS